MGVPITIVTLADGVEQGYRVLADDYYLPDLGLSDDETAALRVAVNAVTLGSGARAGEGALQKLGGGEASAVSPIAALPLAPALPALFDAHRRRATVAFEYRGTTRVVEPHALSSARGHWYLVGYDRSRDARRTFRVDRIDADAVEVGPGDEFVVPDGLSPETHLDDAPWQFGTGHSAQALLWVEHEHRAGVEPHADRLVRSDDHGAVYELTYTDAVAFRSYVLGFLDHAEVIAPAELRGDIVAWLEAIEAARASGV